MAADTLIHGSAVAIDGYAVLILGAAGSGKSSLALQLIAYGCSLVADDQVALIHQADGVVVSRPDSLPEMIEARGVGLLHAPMAEPARLVLCVNMDEEENARLPEEQQRDFQGHAIKVINKAHGSHFPAAILLYLRSQAESF